MLIISFVHSRHRELSEKPMVILLHMRLRFYVIVKAIQKYLRNFASLLHNFPYLGHFERSLCKDATNIVVKLHKTGNTLF